jgi:hypothetical protein
LLDLLRQALSGKQVRFRKIAQADIERSEHDISQRLKWIANAQRIIDENGDVPFEVADLEAAV